MAQQSEPLYPAAVVAKQREGNPNPEVSEVTLEVGKETRRVATVRGVGNFITREWTDDPNIPDLIRECKHYENNEGFGLYRIFDIDFFDASAFGEGGSGGGRPTEPTLRAVVIRNDGDGDCNTGYWGTVFERDAPHRILCDIKSVGDTETETSVRQENVQHLDVAGSEARDDGKVQFVEHKGIVWPRHPLYGHEEYAMDSPELFQAYLSPGKTRGGQLAQLVAYALHKDD